MGCAPSGAFGEAIAHGLFPDPASFTSSSLFARHFFDHNRKRVVVPAAAAGAVAVGSGGAKPIDPGAAGAAILPGVPLSDVKVPPTAAGGDNVEIPDNEEVIAFGGTASAAGSGGAAADTASAGFALGGGDVINPRFSCGVSLNPLYGAGPKIREYYLAIGLQSTYDGKSGFRSPLRLVFVLDTSGSMAAEYSALNIETTKFDVAKSTIFHLLESISAGAAGDKPQQQSSVSAVVAAAQVPSASKRPPKRQLLTENDYVSIVCCNEDVNILLPITQCSLVDVQKVKQQLNAIHPIGGSNLKAGVVVATEMIDLHERTMSEVQYNAAVAAGSGGGGGGGMPMPSAPPLVSNDSKSSIGAPATPSAVQLGSGGDQKQPSAAAKQQQLSSRLVLISDLKPSMGEPKPPVNDPTTGRLVYSHQAALWNVRGITNGHNFTSNKNRWGGGGAGNSYGNSYGSGDSRNIAVNVNVHQQQSMLPGGMMNTDDNQNTKKSDAVG